MNAPRVFAGLLLLSACGSSEPPAESVSEAPAAAPEAPRAPPPGLDEDGAGPRPAGARCLPVVSAECGCVYSCGEGRPTGEGVFQVTHSFWGGTPLTARVDRWCVDEECTDAFHAEVVCTGICAPRPADPTCGFRAGACVTGRSEAMIEGAYRVWWAREREQTGTLSLRVDGRYMYTGRPQPGERRFHFVDHPNGRYTLEMRTDALSTDALEDRAILATLKLDPEGDDFDPDDSRRSLLIRWGQERGVLYARSMVSEFETWRIERSE